MSDRQTDTKTDRRGYYYMAPAIQAGALKIIVFPGFSQYEEQTYHTIEVKVHQYQDKIFLFRINYLYKYRDTYIRMTMSGMKTAIDPTVK